MKRICVFCGSSPGARPDYLQAARHLGHLLAERHLGLVYGGASVGIMGELARAALDGGGEVIGVIPKDLAAQEVAFDDLPDLRVVGSMHERKALMASLSDGFVALPGGFGTFEELFEIMTWAQLGFHQKPCGVLNVCDYYGGLLHFLEHAVQQQFVQAAHYGMLLVDANPEDLLDKFAGYTPPQVDKAAWILRMSNGS